MFTKGYRGLQGITRGYRGLQKVTRVTDSYRLLEMVTGWVTIGYRVVNNYNIKLFTCASCTQQKLISRLGIARQPRITI